jgi:hypothetical protein
MNTALWFVLMLVNGTARISDSSCRQKGDGIGVVYRGQTIRDCKMFLDRSNIQEAPASTDRDLLNATIRDLREAGFDDAQIVRVVVKQGLLLLEGA